jgi:CHAT domain-containing protein/predicted negative regulator of RcsB-dependent stress response
MSVAPDLKDDSCPADVAPIPPKVDELYAEILRLARENLETASRVCAELLALATECGHPGAIGLALRARANVRYLEGDHATALDDYRCAIDSFAACGTDATAEEEIARTRNSAIQTLTYLGRYEEALSWGEQARAVFAARGDALRQARLDGNLGNLYFRLDRFDEALAAYERAFNTFLDGGSSQDIAAVLSNLATCYISVGRFDDSLRCYHRARQHSERHGFLLLLAQADYNIAYLHLLRGDHREAMRLYALARQHARDAGDKLHASLCDLDQAEAMLDLNLLEECVRLSRAAISGFRRLRMRYERAKAGVFLGIAFLRLQQGQRARRTLQAGSRLFAAEGNPVWPSWIELHLAALDLDNGNTTAARTRAEAALQAFEGRQLPGKTAVAECLLARILMREGDTAGAESLCCAALARASAMSSLGLEFECRFLLGEILTAQGDSPRALESFTAAEQDLRQLRSGIPEEELRIRFFENKAALFERLVHLHLEDPRIPRHPAAAWQAVQSAKSRTFLETFLHRASAPAALRGQAGSPVAALRAQLQQGYARGAAAEMRGDLREAQQWQHRSRQLECQLRELLAGLRLAHGDGAALGTTLPAVPDVQGADLAASPASVRERLPRDTVLLEYFATPERVYAFVLDPKQDLQVIGLGATPDLRRLARLALFQMSSFPLRQPQWTGAPVPSSALDAHLNRLRAELIAPAARYLQAANLLLAPHSFLHSLPFSAFGTPQHPLVSEFTIHRTLSGSAVASPSRRKPHASARSRRPSLVMGVADQRAPLIREELRCVASRLPGATLREGSQATIRCFREEGADARIIHIASHGLFRADNPLFSAIRLGDGNLTVLELHDMHLSADLVVLSGCNTGVHAVIGGDELLGLSRGFFYAGASQVLLTLWDVNDASTARFMDLFYESLGGGSTAGTALRQASLRLREEFPHPYHWAGFSLLSAGAADGAALAQP